MLAWTDDPGVVRCACSDGKERLIPSFAIAEGGETLPPKPDYEKMKEEGTFQYFGASSGSE